MAEVARPVAVLTGAAGFLGRAFRQELTARGYEVRGIDVRPGPDVTVGDISRPGAWTAAMEGADLVVHCAAIISESGDEATFWRLHRGCDPRDDQPGLLQDHLPERDLV
jgi:nucleoside-diphosphate-sugar epimerase